MKSTKSILLRQTVILIILLVTGSRLHAQTASQHDRWGKNAYISKTTATLDGVKPLAHWIWDNGAENPRNYYLLVRKTFKLDKVPTSAIAYISAYAYADVYINGRLFERCPMNSDPEYQCYDKFDIAGYLKPGANIITAVVQNFGVGLHSQIDARGGFFLQAKLNYPGRSIDLLTDNTWKVKHADAWNSHSEFRDTVGHLIGFKEDFDARLWPQNWQSLSFNDKGWENAKMIGIPPVAPWNGITVTERPHLLRTIVKPIRQWKSGNKMVFDFGTEIVGYPQFTVNAKKGGVRFEIGTGERLDTNRTPLLRVSGDHSDNYTTREGLQSWRPYTWAGFRYISIEINKDVDIKEVSAEYSRYNYAIQSSFECSDPQLNKFFNIGKYSMQIYSVDCFEDPWREHTQYIAGDSRYYMVYANYAFGKSSRFLTAYDVICGAESQRWRNDGAVRGRYPTGYLLQPGSSAYLADYQLEYIIMMYEYALYYGDNELIERLYPNLKRAVEYFKPFVDPQTGLLSNLPGWIVLDWPSTYPIDQKKAITGTNCLYYGALNAAATVATDFGHDPQQAAIWRKQAVELRKNINDHLWSEKDKAYLDSYGSNRVQQQSQVYALKYGVADADKKPGMIDLIMRSGKASEESFAYYVLYTMFDEGKDQWALDYMRKNWGDQTKLSSFNGAWHEGWDLWWGSTSHAWSSGPTGLLPQKILGLEPLTYGWKTFSMKPMPCDLMWAKGNVETVSGNIVANWKRTADNQFTVTLTVPPGTLAKVYLPASKLSSITVNGKPGDLSKYKLHREYNKWGVLTAVAGTYVFTCALNKSE